jgi:hypothetical protein
MTTKIQTGKLAAALAAMLCLGAAGVQAADYDIKEMTADVHKAMSNRAARYESVQKLKSTGALGENNRGYLEALNASASAGAAVADENADRKVIYQAIVKQNELPDSAMSQVEATFAEVQRDKSKAGDSIQLPTGQWTKK